MKRFCTIVLSILLYASCNKQTVKNNLIVNIDSITYQKNKDFIDYKLDLEIDERLKKDTTSWKYHNAFFDYALKGEYKKALENYDKASKKVAPNIEIKSKVDSIKSVFEVYSAVDYISEQSKLTNIVIVNEAHHNSMHRIFTKSLLKKLYNNGYRSLGLEALYNGPKGGTVLNNGGTLFDSKDTLLNQRG